MTTVLLHLDGEVQNARALTFDDLASVDAAYQVDDVSRIDPKRQGQAVTLGGLLKLAGPTPAARFLGLHSSTDDFHASIPLEPILERALLIYALDGRRLPASSGGPVRFFIPDFAVCRTHEIDECANVKFVDHIELTQSKGRDNRPQDETEHDQLHGR